MRSSTNQSQWQMCQWPTKTSASPSPHQPYRWSIWTHRLRLPTLFERITNCVCSVKRSMWTSNLTVFSVLLFVSKTNGCGGKFYYIFSHMQIIWFTDTWLYLEMWLDTSAGVFKRLTRWRHQIFPLTWPILSYRHSVFEPRHPHISLIIELQTAPNRTFFRKTSCPKAFISFWLWESGKNTKITPNYCITTIPLHQFTHIKAILLN